MDELDMIEEQMAAEENAAEEEYSTNLASIDYTTDDVVNVGLSPFGVGLVASVVSIGLTLGGVYAYKKIQQKRQEKKDRQVIRLTKDDDDAVRRLSEKDNRKAD